VLTYDIWLTDRAKNNIREIFRYISLVILAPDTASEQVDRISEMISTLDTFPKRIKRVEYEPHRSIGYRIIWIDNYSVAFVIKDNVVFVTNIVYTYSDVRNRLGRQ
jgi:plasmid stabilization system protein ParE